MPFTLHMHGADRCTSLSSEESHIHISRHSSQRVFLTRFIIVPYAPYVVSLTQIQISSGCDSNREVRIPFSRNKNLLVVLLGVVINDVEEAELVDTLGGGDDAEPVTELLLLEELLGAAKIVSMRSFVV